MKRSNNANTTEMSNAVSKSLPILVGPSEATPGGNLRLTSIDSVLSSLPLSALFIFERPIHQPATETIRRALSGALVPYYPIAGRLAAGARGLELACTGEGVAFVAASASCTLQDSMLFHPPPAIPLEDLAVTYAEQVMRDPPLLMIQVTEFSCGGFVVGVTWNHAIADGVGLAQFLHAVGELARGLPSPSVVPVRSENSLPELPPSIISMAQWIVSSEPNDFACSYITVPMSFINRIKNELRHSEEDRNETSTPCTAFDVAAAAIWQCRARATMSNPKDPAALAFTANVRKHARAKDGYFRNCFTFQPTLATCGVVANGDIIDLVKLVKDAKGRVPYTFMDEAANNSGAQMGGGGGVGQLQGLCGYDTLYLSSWLNLGFDDVDFGGGSAARVMCNMERKVVPSCFLCERKEKAGVIAMAFCVKEEHVEAFQAELGRLG